MRKQNGSVLIVVLVFLIIFTIYVISTIKVSNYETDYVRARIVNKSLSYSVSKVVRDAEYRLYGSRFLVEKTQASEVQSIHCGTDLSRQELGNNIPCMNIYEIGHDYSVSPDINLNSIVYNDKEYPLFVLSSYTFYINPSAYNIRHGRGSAMNSYSFDADWMSASTGQGYHFYKIKGRGKEKVFSVPDQNLEAYEYNKDRIIETVFVNFSLGVNK
ncbi:hypothetical protein VQ643_03925 [Pseudomonas sp. F1_0610]|uniref:hypothetical protein n=1 Tax=Pseudomonas sp. F1_0610 TaxID=3114284 RepID=UPI0039C0DF2A